MYTPPKLFWHPVSGLHADGVPRSHHLAQLCWARLRPNPLTMNLSAKSPSEDICCVLRWMQRFHWMPRIGLDIFALCSRWPYWWKSWPTVQVHGTGQNVGMGQNAVPLRYVHVCTGCSKQHWTTTNLALSKTNKREEYPQHGVVQDWAQATAVELRLEILAHWQPIAESKDSNGDSEKVVKVTRKVDLHMSPSDVWLLTNFVFAPLSSQARYQNTAWQSVSRCQKGRGELAICISGLMLFCAFGCWSLFIPLSRTGCQQLLVAKTSRPKIDTYRNCLEWRHRTTRGLQRTTRKNRTCCWLFSRATWFVGNKGFLKHKVWPWPRPCW